MSIHSVSIIRGTVDSPIHCSIDRCRLARLHPDNAEIQTQSQSDHRPRPQGRGVGGSARLFNKPPWSWSLYHTYVTNTVSAAAVCCVVMACRKEGGTGGREIQRREGGKETE